jgi:hypothetical protein
MRKYTIQVCLVWACLSVTGTKAGAVSSPTNVTKEKITDQIHH